MKSILLSIRPEWVVKILNGEKTIEIRKKFPKDYVGLVYIYSTKVNLNKNKLLFLRDKKPSGNDPLNQFNVRLLNGKVVARFWCDKVEDIKSQIVNYGNDCLHTTETMNMTELLKTSCLSLKELDSYLGEKNGYAIHFSFLEVFDKPRELSEFTPFCKSREKYGTGPCNICKYLDNYHLGMKCLKRLTKAPQNYQFIESKE